LAAAKNNWEATAEDGRVAAEVADLGAASMAAVGAVAEAASAAVAAAPHPLRKVRPAVHPEELTRVRAAGPEPNPSLHTPARVVPHPPIKVLNMHTQAKLRFCKAKRNTGSSKCGQLVAPVVSMTNVRIILVTTTFIF